MVFEVYGAYITDTTGTAAKKTDAWRASSQHSSMRACSKMPNVRCLQGVGVLLFSVCQ